MKPVLYEATETSFTSKGLGTLPDVISCFVDEARNGEFDLEMQISVNSKHFSDVKLERIILAKPNPYDNPQPFRIYKITKPINGVVSVLANHLSYDLKGYPVEPVISEGCAAAVADIVSNAVIPCPFTFTTDINSDTLFTVAKPYTIRDLMGGVEGSLIDTYGGEYQFDKFTVQLLSARGQNRGVKIKYGVNLIDLTQEENCTSVYTGVLPYYASEKGIVTGTVQRASGTFPIDRILPLDLTSHFTRDYNEADVLPTAAQLNTAGAAYVVNNSIGVPKVSLDLSFAQLGRKEVHLCDTVTVEFERMGIETTAKVIETIYDVLEERYKSVKIGDPRANIINSIQDEAAARAAEDERHRSYLERSDSAIRARVVKIGGTTTSFGWEMTDSAHAWYSNSVKVMEVRASGLTVDGNVTARSGFIGNGSSGFTISATAIYNGLPTLWGDSNGVYLGTDGIALGGGKFKVTSAGALTATSADISGKITSRSGEIGGFTIGQNAIYNVLNSLTGTDAGVYLGTNGISLYKDATHNFSIAASTGRMTLRGGMSSLNDDTNTAGTYFGYDGIALGGGKFKVTSGGSVTAKDMAITGGSISLGNDGADNPVFSVSSQGAVTAKNLTLTGGSINIADTFKVSSTGVLTANMTGGSITLGQNFAVTNSGAVTAKNLTLTGGSISLGDDGTEQHNPVFRVTNAGAVTAKDLTLTGGSINIGNKFKVSTTGVLTADMTGGSITLGENFAVTSTGAVTAKNLTLSGGSIALGNDGNNNPVFSVTSGGAVTAKNLALTGGSINIKDGNGDTAFSVSSTGAVTASNLSITGGSININNGAFRVDADGNLYANSGSFGGTVNAENIQSTGVQGSGGYLSGSAISQQSIPANRVGDNVLTTGQFANGVNSSLGYANAYNSATQSGTGTYPQYFTAGNLYVRGGQILNEGDYLIKIASGGGYATYNLQVHTHQISADSSGKVTIGAADWTGTAHSFNIADTDFYRRAVSAITVKTVAELAHTTSSDKSVTVSDGNVRLIDGYLKGRILATLDNDNTSRIYVALKADKAYDAGAATVSVQGSSGLTITTKNAHKTSGSHHYVNVDVTPTAQTTKLDGTKVTATNTINRDINADTVYADGRSSVVVNGASAVSYGGEYDFNPTIANSRISYSGGYLYGAVNVTLDNSKTYTVYVKMDGTKAYDAGAASAPTPSYSITDGDVSADPNNPYDSSNPNVFYVKATFKVDGNSKSYTSWVNVNSVYSAGQTAGANGVSITSTSYSSYSTSADNEVTLGYSYVRYDSSNDQIKGRISVTLSNGSTETIFVKMDASRVSSASISSVSVDSYSTSYDYSVQFDDYYLRYSDGYIKGRASVSLSNGTSSTVYIEMDGTKAYNAGASSVPSPSYDITNGNVSAYDYNGEYVMYVTATFDVDGNSKSYNSWVNVYDAYQAGAASVPSPTIETRLYVRMNGDAYIGGTWVYHTSVWPVTWVNGEEYQWGDEYYVYLTYDAGEGYVS